MELVVLPDDELEGLPGGCEPQERSGGTTGWKYMHSETAGVVVLLPWQCVLTLAQEEKG